MKLFRDILSHLATFLISLLLAILIWAGASQQNNPMMLQSLQIPLNLVGQPENSTLELSTENVIVVVEAPSSVLSELSSDDFSATIDLSQIPLGENVSLPITVNTAVPGVNINDPVPGAVDVRLEQLLSREVPVVLDVRGSVARGHTQGDPLIDPQTITVVGTAEQVNPLDAARVTVFLNNVRETVVDTAFPIFYDRRGQVASVSGVDSVSAESIQVTIPVEESADFAEKFIDINWTGTPADGYRLLSVTVDPPSVLVQGLPTRLSQLSQVTTDPIDITGLTESFSQQVALDLPEGITLDEGQTVIVNVEIEPILTTGVYNRPVEFQGVEEGLEAAADPDEVRVVLFGPLPILDSLTEDEVRVTVDAFGLLTGTYSLEPVVTFPDRGLELRSIQPPLVTVEITSTLTDTLTQTEQSRLPGWGITAVPAPTVPSTSPTLITTQFIALPQETIL
jgi:YbbR domain-containing protein